MKKKFNWRLLILTSIVTLLPITLGLAFYGELPARVVIHWGINNEPNGWASKNLFVFGLPLLMLVLQLILLIGTTLKKADDQPFPKVVKVLTWFIPLLTVILYSITLAVALGNEIDIRKVVCLILGILFIVMGNYIPKMSFQNRKMINMPIYPESEAVWRVFSRVMGVSFIVEGFLMIASIFFPPAVSIIVICLLIGLLLGLSFYGSAISKKK